MIENSVIYLIFWILKECIHIGAGKVISNEYLIGSICFPMQCFLGILGIALIRWISLRAKTIVFVGQKTTLILT